MKTSHPAPNYLTPLLFGAILFLALLLRLNGLDWGMPNPVHPGYSYHPDEIYLLRWAQMLQEGSLIPKHFIYGGTFYYHTLQVIIWFGRLLAATFGGQELFTIFLIGRSVGVLYALATIGLVYAVGSLLYSRTAGLLAALILAVLPAHVFHAQVIRPDELFALEYAGNLWFMARILKRRGTPMASLVGGGLLLGVTVATRFPAGALFLAYVLAIFLALAEEFPADPTRVRQTALRYLAILAGLSCLGYAVASPTTFFHFREFLAGLQVQWHYQSGLFLDAVERGPTWYQYGGRMLHEALGLPFQILALAATVYALWKRRGADLLLLALLLPYGLMLAKTSWVVTRYLVPLLPVLALIMVSLLRDLAGRNPRLKVLAAGMVVVASLWSVTLDLAYAKTLRGPDPRDAAAQWLAESASPQARVGTVDCYKGDYFTPPPQPQGQQWDTFHLNQEGVGRFLDQPFDFIVINEAILADTKRLGTKYPQLLPYHELLLWSKTSPGYTLVKTFPSSVEIGGLDLGDDFASVDCMLARPTILIYRRNPS